MAQRRSFVGLALLLCLLSLGCGDLFPWPTSEPMATPTEYTPATGTPTELPAATATPTEAPTATPELPAACPDGWLEYVDDMFNYRICYPPDATLTQSGVSGVPTDEVPAGMTPSEYMDQIQAQYGDHLCISIDYLLGYVNIAPPPNAQFQYAICGRTGVGTGTMNPGTETLEIQGIPYDAQGYEHICDTMVSELLDCHNETYVLRLADDTRIEYGAGPSGTNTYADYLITTKDVLVQIVESYWQH
jgi:hypothetical protein